ncbi:alpha/beta fold hydrolase [Crossiella cryophila]|uniref:Proline iminopeptidase n=1 Tax=Crossiella cryophila TaxID=43355 RepID=A0A7W7CDS4_9PSEU|nr:alpha/beta hydrolase [Crossiella cryophila]MBB4677689.1 proline iminopeptidase [Crossiella cryophila]
MTDVLSAGSHLIEVGGIRQRYHVAGTGPLCLVHPGGPGIHWEYLRMPALERHLTLVYLEPVGTGRSEALPGGRYTVRRYAEFVDGVIDHLGGPEVYFLGHSHGAFVGLQYALDHPDRLSGLILYDGAPTMDTPEFAEELARGVRDRLAAHPGDPDTERAAAAFGRTPITDDASLRAYLGTVLPLYFADYAGTDLSGWLGTLDATHDPDRLREPWDVRDDLDVIHTPTLVIVGRQDFICGPRWAQELATGIPTARLVVLEHSGHFGHLEEPEPFLGAVTAFTGSAQRVSAVTQSR